MNPIFRQLHRGFSLGLRLQELSRHSLSLDQYRAAVSEILEQDTVGCGPVESHGPHSEAEDIPRPRARPMVLRVQGASPPFREEELPCSPF